MDFQQELIPGLPLDVALHCLARVPHSIHPRMQGVCRDWKNLVASAGFYALRKESATTRPAIVLLQATNPPKSAEEPTPAKATSSLPRFGLTLVDPASRSWSALPGIPGLDGMPLFAGIAGVESKLVVVGGWNPATFEAMKSVFVFDFSTGSWRRGSDMPGEARSFFAMAALGDGSIFVAGGHDENKNALRSCHRYRVREDRWESMPDMAAERDEARGIAIEVADHSRSKRSVRFGVISGYGSDSQGGFCGSGEFLDPETRTWSKVEGLIDGAMIEQRNGTNLFLGDARAGSAAVYCMSRSSGEIWSVDGAANAVGCSRRVGQLPAGGGKAVAAVNGGGVGGGALLVIAQDERGVVRGFAMAPKDSAKDSKDSPCPWEEALGDGGDEFRGTVQAACYMDV